MTRTNRAKVDRERPIDRQYSRPVLSWGVRITRRHRLTRRSFLAGRYYFGRGFGTFGNWYSIPTALFETRDLARAAASSVRDDYESASVVRVEVSVREVKVGRWRKGTEGRETDGPSK